MNKTQVDVNKIKEIINDSCLRASAALWYEDNIPGEMKELDREVNDLAQAIKAEIEAEISARKEAWKKELLEKLPKEIKDIYTGWDIGYNNCLDEIKKLIEEV
jgi:predicted transcriptional regulator